MEVSVRRKAVDFTRRLGRVDWIPATSFPMGKGKSHGNEVGTPIHRVFDLITAFRSCLGYYFTCFTKLSLRTMPCYRKELLLLVEYILFIYYHIIYTF